MTTPMDDIGYLIRSRRRVETLELLANGPRTVGELATEIDASRKTIRRAVSTFEGYGWVRRDGRRYEVTSLGALVAERTRDLLEAGAITRRLRPIVSSLPASFDIDLGLLEDARVTLPGESDTVAPARRMVEVLRSADTVRAVAFAVAPGAVEATRDGSRAELVLTTSAFEFIADHPSMASRLQEMYEAGWPIRRYDGELEYNLVIADGTVMLGLVDERGAPSGLIESENETVREWADDRFERYRDLADPVEPERFRV